jgi:type I restriction enzyme R subunit
MGSRRSEVAPSDALRYRKLVLECRKKRQGRADVRMTIERILDGGLPEAFPSELFRAKAEAVFQHACDC